MINSYVCFDGDADALLRRLDAAGFERALLAGSPDGMLVGDTRYPSGMNERVAAAVRAHPDRFLGCAYLDPRGPDAAKRAADFAGRGFCAVRLIPADGYSPDDPALYPFLERLEEWGLTAVWQMGLCEFRYESRPGSRRAPNSALGSPMRLDPVCRLFPGLRLLILNMGYPWMAEAWSVHHNSANIYLHLGGERRSFLALATAYVAMGGAGFIPLHPDRVVFGSSDAEDIARAALLGGDSLRRMGLDAAAAFGENGRRLYALP